jgi:hypothetical protein
MRLRPLVAAPGVDLLIATQIMPAILSEIQVRCLMHHPKSGTVAPSAL